MKEGELGAAVPSKANARPELAPILVGIAGLGRSGWDIHAATIGRLSDRFQVVAVADDAPSRRQEARARFGCRIYSSVDSLVSDPDVQLLIVATPNHLHAEHSIFAMHAGKDVLCEKPMATNPAEAEAMIEVAHRTGRLLSVFNVRRFDPHFLQVRQIVDSGVLGRIVQVRLAVHQFTRRWDWQTLQKYGGGMLNNIGAHFLDLLLSFFPDDTLPQVTCHLDRVLTLGDADDHCNVILRQEGCPMVQLELSNACGLPQDHWLIMGDRGTLSGNFDSLRWRVADLEALPARELEKSPRSAERTYARDTVHWEEHAWKAPAEQSVNTWQQDQFFRALYRTLRHGDPLAVTPESVLRCLRVIDAAHASATQPIESTTLPATPVTTLAPLH